MSSGGKKGVWSCLTILIMAWTGTLSMAGSPVWAQTADPLSTDTSNCDTPAATPACATLAFAQCLWLNKPSLCAAIGAGDLIIWEGPFDSEADLAAIPREYVGRLGRRFPVIYEMSPEANVVGRLNASGLPILGSDTYSGGSRRILAVHQVDRRRFQDFDDVGTIVPDRFIGSHEVLLGPEFLQSIFFRLDGSRWIITSFVSDGMDCIVNSPADNYFIYLWRCHRSAPILDWASFYPGLWTKLTKAAPK